MAPALASIPVELFQHITSLLLLPDQAALARTSKTFNHLLTPTIWGDVELHYAGTHEGIQIESEADALDWEEPKERRARELAVEPQYPYKKLVFSRSTRKYAQGKYSPSRFKKIIQSKGGFQFGPSGRATSNCNRRNFQYGREERFIGVRKITSKERWEELSQHVRSLCLSIGVDDEVAEVIASFSNLESLELIGLPLAKGHTATAPEIKLPRLRNLKLRGYFSAALARKFCSHPENIKYLNIGLLATRTDDKAYAATLLKNNNGLALVTDEQAEYYLKNGAEAAGIEPQPADEGYDTDYESSGEDSDDEDDENDDDRPWALHSPIWLPRSLPQQFKSLTHLHLVKPYTGESDSMLAHDHFQSIPHRYEQILCKEWVFMLEAVAGTVKELILEHRIPEEIGDTVGDGDPHPDVKGGNRSAPWSISPGETDPGDELFCRSVLRLLLKESSRFSELKRLSFRGIQIKGIPIDKDSVDVPGKNGVPNNDEELRRLFPRCKIDIFEDSYPVIVYAGYVYESWPENRHEAMQDEGDGLLYNLCYYNDYKKRFGPQWRLPG